MPFQIACPNTECDSSYTIADDRLGGVDRCKKCGTEFSLVPPTLPGQGSEPPSGADTDSWATPSPTGEVDLPNPFGRYRIDRRLGAGGMGAVYLAYDTHLDRTVALKVPHRQDAQDAEVRGRFLREARALAQFHHPNFCPIFDAGEVDGIPYLTMRYIEGRTLSVGQPWDQREAAELARRLAVALAALHAKGIIHRDLKPANVMVEDGGGLILMDFGLARRLEGGIDPTITRANAILGTPSYMSPEQARGKAVDHRSDVYSLGVILYQLLTGRLPFVADTVLAVLVLIATEDPEPPSTLRPGLDPRLEAICRKSMAKKPDDRHASMEKFAGALAAFLAGANTPPPKPRDELPHAEPPPPQPKVDKSPITNTLGMKLVLIPAGEFDMGSDASDPGALPNEQVAGKKHRVRITRPFYLGTTEVTQGQYRAVTDANPSFFKGSDDLPVEQVSWLDAIRFCNALSTKEGLTPFYRIEGDDVSVPDWKGPGYRLPTEAEWEYACRAGPGGAGAYGFGDDAAQLGRHAWYKANSEGKIHPVGQKVPNAWGLFDMHGNVWEWCWDRFGAYEAGPVVDPVGPSDGSDRVIRGGSWSHAAESCRAAFRFRNSPTRTNYNLGLRLARVPSGRQE